ncbi:hypothetical protein CK203_112614 [Vitis vinifera]|uniref:Uncharacterized protein n=1 Tax=Vitis vinifera TaxID=29760 RepID=A0A438CC78_VITVI|nr:hypothetical protein CK203_112614 [Vitis vinifera]
MPNISWMSFKSFNNLEVEGLNALFYEEEVFRALSNLNKDKAVEEAGGKGGVRVPKLVCGGKIDP